MNSVKLNKKHLFSILLTLVLLFSLNLNIFATSGLVSFYDYSFVCNLMKTDNTFTNVTSSVTKKRSSDNAPNGRAYTRFDYNILTTANVKYTSLTTGADLDLYTDTEYEFDFQIKISDSSDTLGCNITLYVGDASNEVGEIITLYNEPSGGLKGDTWHTVKGKFKVPNLSGSIKYAMVVILGDTEGSKTIYDNIFYITDMNINPISPLHGEPCTPADTDELVNSLREYENSINQLPSINAEDIDILFDFNFDSYTAGMNFVKDMFDNILRVIGFQGVLNFALIIGLATYILGRKVG